jgi:hypothetical protein
VANFGVSRQGQPIAGVGGGSQKNSVVGVYVARPSGNGSILPPATFIREHGDLACATDQAYVALKEGDYIVEVSGPRPVDLENPELGIAARKVLHFDSDNRPILSEPIAWQWMPESVIKGLSAYHNRDGSYFVGKEEGSVHPSE